MLKNQEYTVSYECLVVYVYPCIPFSLFIQTHTKLWELASGRLKLTLTGHISSVRAIVVSPRQPYLFSAGEDKQVKCWDLEVNKVCVYPVEEVYCL